MLPAVPSVDLYCTTVGIVQKVLLFGKDQYSKSTALALIHCTEYCTRQSVQYCVHSTQYSTQYSTVLYCTVL
jgi:hypothetical protein